MRIRWYIDEDAMARALVTGLRARNVDVLTYTVGEQLKGLLKITAETLPDEMHDMLIFL